MHTLIDPCGFSSHCHITDHLSDLRAYRPWEELAAPTSVCTFDPPEAVYACLHCVRAKCNNCVGPGGQRYREFHPIGQRAEP